MLLEMSFQRENIGLYMKYNVKRTQREISQVL